MCGIELIFGIRSPFPWKPAGDIESGSESGSESGTGLNLVLNPGLCGI